MKFLMTSKSLTNFSEGNFPFKLHKGEIGDFHYLIEDPKELLEANGISFFIDGYIRDLNLPAENINNHHSNCSYEISKDWPLPANITGSFSAVIFNNKNRELIFCNDLIGVYPLYYLIMEGELFVSNSIILMALVSTCELDDVGIVQRSIGPEYSNFGSRTILRNCKRLLPGEYIVCKGKKIIERKFDNSLYQSISEPDQNHNLHFEYWEAFKKEVKYTLIDFAEINLALSGGLDSRLLLGAIPDDHKVKCLTYGANDYYETKVAKGLARKTRSEFKNFSDLDLYFPSLEILEKYHSNSEAVLVCSWLEILENIKLEDREPILLGDMTEALAGRNIKAFSSRAFRQQNFFKYHFFKRDYNFEKSTKEKYEQWLQSITHHYDRWYTKDRVNRFEVETEREDLVQGLHHDLNEIFSRIKAHHLPYVELYDELFMWYTHSRIPMGSQILICNRDFYSYCPPMSIQVLRMTSNIHPNLRLGNRFLNKLFRLKDLKSLNTVPTSQAPLVPQYFPGLFKMPIWGIRSKMDHYLINRLVKSKNPRKRYRLFKSLNWPLIYQNKNLDKHIDQYFESNHLGEGQYNYIKNRAQQRKDLLQWPFGNNEIISNASLNTEINIIDKYRH
ncbi:hypothetical protein [Christiangramia portivictoriae]|uniref:hypothetical protein n=1 Tax=Christiangramia portivictoriae TaxID=326069 RepID=UPI00041A0FDF|nr:hypothetical protein [Christiangramia portivictoriae]